MMWRLVRSLLSAKRALAVAFSFPSRAVKWVTVALSFAILSTAFGPALSQEMSTGDEIACFDRLMSGEVPWHVDGHSNWSEPNVRGFCTNINRPDVVIDCFVRELGPSTDWVTTMLTCKTPTYGGALTIEQPGLTGCIRFSNYGGLTVAERNQICKARDAAGLLPEDYDVSYYDGLYLSYRSHIDVRKCCVAREMGVGTKREEAVQICISEGATYYDAAADSCFKPGGESVTHSARIVFKRETGSPIWGVIIGEKRGIRTPYYREFIALPDLPVEVELPFARDALSGATIEWKSILLFDDADKRDIYRLDTASKTALELQAMFLDATGVTDNAENTVTVLSALFDTDYSGIIAGSYSLNAGYGNSQIQYFAISGTPPTLLPLNQRPEFGPSDSAAVTPPAPVTSAPVHSGPSMMRGCEREVRGLALSPDVSSQLTGAVIADLCLGQEEARAPSECFGTFASGGVPWSVEALNSPMPNDYTIWQVPNIVRACQGTTSGEAMPGCVAFGVGQGSEWSEVVERCRVESSAHIAAAQDCSPFDWNSLWNVFQESRLDTMVIATIPAPNGSGDWLFNGTLFSGVTFTGTVPAANACEARGEWSSDSGNGRFRFVMGTDKFTGVWTAGDENPVGLPNNWLANRAQ